MNNNIIHDYNQRLKMSFECLSLNLSKSPMDTAECLEKIKLIRKDITHLYNLIKIQEDIKKKE